MVLYSLHVRFEWCCTPRAGFLNGPPRPACPARAFHIVLPAPHVRSSWQAHEMNNFETYFRFSLPPSTLITPDLNMNSCRTILISRSLE